MMKKQLCNFRVYYCHRSFFYRIVLSIFVLTVMFQTEVKASMGTMTVKGIEAEIVSSSDSMKLSRTTLKTLSSQGKKHNNKRCIRNSDGDRFFKYTDLNDIKFKS